MTETVTQAASNAVATRDNGPRALVAQYSRSFHEVLPSHIRPEQWVRLAQGALKKGRRVADADGRQVPELELAARNNPAVFLASLLDAARLGLEPGTEQYYLTPRKVTGRLEVLGIIGYQGHIELMYRAGAISSVVAEVVYEHDRFQYRPGVDERPIHEIDWDAEDRGALRLVYAYAVMKDGATSKVVVLNRGAIAAIKKSSASASFDSSPWTTHPASMWLKSAVRQLAKWVPTSAERLGVAATPRSEVMGPVSPTSEVPADVTELPEVRNDDFDPEVVDAELVDRADEQAELEDQGRQR